MYVYKCIIQFLAKFNKSIGMAYNNRTQDLYSIAMSCSPLEDYTTRAPTPYTHSTHVRTILTIVIIQLSVRNSIILCVFPTFTGL